MTIEIRVPPLPESVSDAELVNWHKKVGDRVQRDENLVDLETDKVVLEIPAPQDGVISRIVAGNGTTVASNDLIAVLDTQAGASPEAQTEPVQTTEPEPEQAAAAPEPQSPALSPAVRRLVEEHQLNPDEIPSTGKNGRLIKADILAWLDRPQPDTKPTPPPSANDARERRVPMTKLRQRIAERLVEAQHTTASLTTFNEVNMQAVMDLRSRYKERFEKEYGSRLGFMSFFVKATIEALRRFPSVNAAIEDDHIIYHDYYDIGIAVSSPRGLVVPVLRDANRLSFAETETRIRNYGAQAREGTLSIDDLIGGSFTITNGGVFGSLLSTPILNPPQSAILGMHKIEQRAVVEDGEIVARPLMYLALTYDHRIIDGREAVQFLVSIKETLEDPARLLLQI